MSNFTPASPTITGISIPKHVWQIKYYAKLRWLHKDLHRCHCEAECGQYSKYRRYIRIFYMIVKYVHGDDGELLGKLILKSSDESGWKTVNRYTALHMIKL